MFFENKLLVSRLLYFQFMVDTVLPSANRRFLNWFKACECTQLVAPFPVCLEGSIKHAHGKCHRCIPRRFGMETSTYYFDEVIN